MGAGHVPQPGAGSARRDRAPQQGLRKCETSLFSEIAPANAGKSNGYSRSIGGAVFLSLCRFTFLVIHFAGRTGQLSSWTLNHVFLYFQHLREDTAATWEL